MTSNEDRPQTDVARDAAQKARKSQEVERLWRHLARLCSGKRCLVLGSAPDPKVPPPGRFDVLICINGSPWIAQKWGLKTPDLTVVAGYSTLTNKDVRVATQGIWSGLTTRELLFIEAGATAQDGRQLLDACGFRYGAFRSMTIIERAAIIGQLCGVELGLGPRDERISNGMFATVLSIWADASEVILTGFSLSGGHSYMTDATPREHLEGDIAFLKLVHNLGCRVVTTVDEFHRDYGLPLAR